MSRAILQKDFWRQKRVLITGGAGFLGRHLQARLEPLGAKLFVPRKSQFNLIQIEQAKACLQTYQPEIVIHSAAFYGGLGITLAEPGRIYFENLMMGANTMEAARLCGVKKFVSIGTACSYPGFLSNSMSEDELWNGPLHPSVEAYGSVKKMLAIQGNAYKKQYGFNSIHLIPSNLYGPYDSYDPYRSHVVAALIKKFCDAHAVNDSVTVWGTGNAVREFLYVEDCAEGVLLATEKYEETKPLNIGTGTGTRIATLVETIAKTLNFKGTVFWDKSQPDGQAKKTLDTKYLNEKLDWLPPTDLKVGIAKTIQWYQEHLGINANKHSNTLSNNSQKNA